MLLTRRLNHRTLKNPYADNRLIKKSEIEINKTPLEKVSCNSPQN
jgi:hypothetical protein